MHKKMVIALIVPSVVLLALLGSGCGSGHKQGQEAPVASPTATGNIQSRILSVSIASPPVVTFTLFDENAAPVDPAGLIAAGGRVRFTIGRIKDDGNYESYCNGSSTTTGVPAFDKSTPAASHFATVSPGTYTYTFYTDIDNAAQTLGGIVLTGNEGRTHTVVAQIVRNTTTATGKAFQQAANPYLNFRPDGGTVTVTREVVAMSNCNECHFEYGAHGGGRRDVALCVLCHYPGPLDADTGNPLDLKDLVHKIHYGDNLPGNVAGGAYSIGTSGFADVTFPFLSGDRKITGTPIECKKCHRQGFDTSGRPFGKDVAKYRENPTKNKCTTCHNTTTFDGSTTIVVTRLNADNTIDNVTVPAISHADFVGGRAIDVTGVNADNTVLCSACHAQAGVTVPYNTGSVDSIHTIAEQSPAIFPGINFQIVSVTNARPGQAPTVRFKVTTDNGTVIAPSTAGASFNLKLGYPASDYNNIGNTPASNTQGQPFSKALAGATANGDGSYTATFDNTIPASASGVGVIGLEGRASYPLAGFRASDNAVRIGGQAVQYYFDMATGAQVTDPSRTRRRIVDINKCLKCHGRLSLHGANRVNSIEECVICHNPAAFSINEDNTLSGTIDFKVFIHQIHTGEDLDPSQVVFGGADFRSVTYPQDRKNCLACHLDAATPTFGIPLAAGVQGTSTGWGLDNTTNADDPKTPPIQAVCTTCHGDQTFTAPHVANQTVDSTELCAQCHTTGLLLGPDFAHQPVRPFPVE